MCKLSEEIYRDGLHDRARADLKHLMESTGWSLVKAMQVLRIPPEEQDRCREELERFEPVKDSFRGNPGDLSEENRILRELMDVVPIGCYILRPIARSSIGILPPSIFSASPLRKCRGSGVSTCRWAVRLPTAIALRGRTVRP